MNNCIVWGNTATDGVGSDHNHYWSRLTQSCTTPLPPGFDDGGGNIAEDPCFIDPASGDFRLEVFSPCIDAGDNDYADAEGFDLDGKDRILNGTVDMGAYEHDAVPVIPGAWYANIRRADDSGDGRSWRTAKKTLQAAVAPAGAGGFVFAADGVYAPISRTDNAALSIRSVNGAARTTIDGGNTNRCATLGTGYVHTNTVLTGFTLTRGNADHTSVTVRQYYGGGTVYGALRRRRVQRHAERLRANGQQGDVLGRRGVFDHAERLHALGQLGGSGRRGG